MHAPSITDTLTCSICMELLQDPVRVDPCDHYFCRPCIKGWLRKDRMTCPIDRTHVKGFKAPDRIVAEIVERLNGKEGPARLLNNVSSTGSTSLKPSPSGASASSSISTHPANENHVQSVMSRIFHKNQSSLSSATQPPSVIRSTSSLQIRPNMGPQLRILSCSGCDKQLPYNQSFHKCNSCRDTLFCTDCYRSAAFIHPNHSFSPLNYSSVKECGHSCDASGSIIQCCLCGHTSHHPLSSSNLILSNRYCGSCSVRGLQR
ncbi:hypothetical protein BCR33DRAFT_713338 [Rhizoclosmatium globosum]|uniref:RING-type domain-containing protein n=1 Tax=Rhizoclosmatium globosum TaxID=329046 RepID=A0A1Y2CU30_9FUNG|nr:hypothetical protein BCR33DRAFT_713338 [Rhizoclosmatium globosum]|eukprot:ORY50570.1 hypothetical protein BCR33DRAFT_713338 [Rhizoclosmatium globosum]